MKRVRRLPRAERDIAEAAAYYAYENIPLSDRFLTDVETALRQIREMPGVGSLRFSRELGIPEMRTAALSSFPHLIFYTERDANIDVIRVLHPARDIYNLPLGS
jgi:toxin ParE1/3/4